MRKLEVSDDWMSGYRAGLERAAEISALVYPRHLPLFLRDEIATAIIDGQVADRGEAPQRRGT
jgi:hypothetical protein